VKSNANQVINQVINIEKVIQVIRILRVKRLDILVRLPSAPLERERMLRELENEIVQQLGVDDYLTVSAVNALVNVIDKPFADSVYTSLINDLQQLSKLKLAELKVVTRSLWDVEARVRLQKLPPEEFGQSVHLLKSLKFRFDDILKCWYKIYEAGKPAAHPLA